MVKNPASSHFLLGEFPSKLCAENFGLPTVGDVSEFLRIAVVEWIASQPSRLQGAWLAIGWREAPRGPRFRLSYDRKPWGSKADWPG